MMGDNTLILETGRISVESTGSGTESVDLSESKHTHSIDINTIKNSYVVN